MTLQRIKFNGTIVRADQRFPIEFETWAGEDSRLQIEIEPLPAQVLLALQGAMGKPGSFSEALVLEGIGPRDETFFSDSVDVRGVNFGTSGNVLKVAARKAKIVIHCAESVLTPRMRLWFRGFKSFRNPRVKTSLGLVEVLGDARDVAVDDMSGNVIVQAEAETKLEGWVERADDFLTFMHRGLGFAHGSRLQTPRLDLRIGCLWEVTYYQGDGFGVGLPPIHHLNQGPFIEALAKRFDDPRPFPDMIWTAIGWLHNDNSFDEGRFLMSMTALEAMVEHVIPKSLTTVVSKDNFEVIRAKLLEAITISELEETPRKIFEGKVKSLNGRTLSQKIQALRDHYGLSKAIFSDDAVVEIIRARNDIVHTGESAGQGKLWSKVVFVRELISQIVFHEIGYSGPYESYVDGYRMVHPGLETAATSSGASSGD
ncbi:hypothetical protein AAFG07_33165 [Bradyrhizobium sp. B097]|uniref:hypothetical protein n=1 Tax=Bradyrhizobium sp. B097 TaxID=3140244 RepID=UPI003183F7B1